METTYKTPPHSIPAEREVIGCCLIDGATTVAMCINMGLKVQMFYSLVNQLIMNRLYSMLAQGKPIDLSVLIEEMTVAKELESVGGYAYLMEVSGATPTTIKAKYFVNQIKEMATLRSVIAHATLIVEQCYGYEGDGISLALGPTVSKLLNCTMGRGEKEDQDWNQVIDEALLYVESIEKHEGPPPEKLLELPFPQMNDLFGKPERGQLIVLGGLPSSGKSSLARQVVTHAAFDKHFVYMVTLEVNPARVVLNMAQCATKIGLKVLGKAHHLDRADFKNYLRGLRSAGVYMSKSDRTVGQIVARAKALHAQIPGGMGLVVIDHGRLLDDLKVSRDEQETVCGAITKAFKDLAMELDCWVLLLWQLNGDGKDEPEMTHLKGSRDIEANADKIWMPHRPKTTPNGVVQDAKTHVKNLPVYFQNLIQVKGRDDGVATLSMEFVREIATWREIKKEKENQEQDDLPI